MRIGINLLYLLPDVVGGTETYAAGLLQGLAATASDDEFVVFVNREAADWPLPAEPRFTRCLSGNGFQPDAAICLRADRTAAALAATTDRPGSFARVCRADNQSLSSHQVNNPRSELRGPGADISAAPAPYAAFRLNSVSKDSKRNHHHFQLFKREALRDPEASCRQNHGHAPGRRGLSLSRHRYFETWPELRQRYGIREPTWRLLPAWRSIRTSLYYFRPSAG